MLLISSIEPLSLLLQIIYQKYLGNSYCLTVVSDNSLDASMMSTSMHYVNPNSIGDLSEALLSASDQGCPEFIVQVTNPESFMATFENITRMGTLRKSDRKLIFLPSSNTSKASMLDILKITESSYIADLLLILPGNNDGTCEVFDLVTHKFVGPDDEVNDLVFLDQWDSCSGKFFRNSNLFPHDMRDMGNKTLKVTGFTYEPYSILDIDPSIEPLGRDGVEMRIVDEFCRRINCTVEIVGDGGDEWGEIYENGTGNGVSGNVVEDRAELGISALYSWYDSFKVLDFSTSCIRTAVTCIAPAPRRLVSWDLPLMPFGWAMWCTLLVTFIYASIALALAQRNSTDKVFITTFGMMITQSQNDASSTWQVRRITGWLLVTGLIIDNAYSSGLAATFTVPKYEKPTDTIQDIVDSKLEWGATHDAWVFSIVASQEPKMKELVKQFRVYEGEILKQKSFTRSMAFSIEKLPAGYFAIGDYITKGAVLDLELMLEDFYYEQTVVMARKSSPYTARISDLIGRLHETGLLLAWETQVALKYMDFKVQLEVKLSRTRRGAEIVPLTFKHVVGVFIIYLTGVVLSLLLFVVEVCSTRKEYNNKD